MRRKDDPASQKTCLQAVPSPPPWYGAGTARARIQKRRGPGQSRRESARDLLFSGEDPEGRRHANSLTETHGPNALGGEPVRAAGQRPRARDHLVAGVRLQRHERQHRRGPGVAHAARRRPLPRRQPLPGRAAGLRRHPAAQPALRAPGGGLPALGRRLRLDLAHAQPGARLCRQRRRDGLLLPVRRPRRPLHRAVRPDAAGPGRGRLHRQLLGDATWPTGWAPRPARSSSRWPCWPPTRCS